MAVVTDKQPRHRRRQGPPPQPQQHNTSAGDERGARRAWLLLPELAQLQQLEDLWLSSYGAPLPDGIPAEWLAPGAFPRLGTCALQLLGQPTRGHLARLPGRASSACWWQPA